MLNFIYYPVSAILWFWHKVFGYVLGDINGFAWALSVIFLVATLRALLIKPFVSQVRSMRKMQEFQPQIKKLQQKYKNDKQKLSEEMSKLNKEHGVNPLNGCLPMFVQIPVFIGLFHVLRGFAPSTTNKFEPLYPYNYVFPRSDIASFLQADLFGVRLSDSIAGGEAALGHVSFTSLSALQFNASAIVVCLPLMLIAAVATHFTARVSQSHQSDAQRAANPQAAMMAKLTMWVFPIGLLLFGSFLPVAILLYWLANNTWTLVQQYLVYKKLAQEEAARREEARQHRDNLAPRVGQKPVRPEDRAGESTTDGVDVEDAVADEPEDAPEDAISTVADDTGSDAVAASGSVAGGRRGSGRPAPGKVNSGGSGGGARSSGSRNPGKVNGAGQGSSNGGQNGGKNAGSSNQTAKSGQNGQNGQGAKNGQKAKNAGGKNGQAGKKAQQLASSGRSGKRKK